MRKCLFSHFLEKKNVIFKLIKSKRLRTLFIASLQYHSNECFRDDYWGKELLEREIKRFQYQVDERKPFAEEQPSIWSIINKCGFRLTISSNGSGLYSFDDKNMKILNSFTDKVVHDCNSYRKFKHRTRLSLPSFETALAKNQTT